MRTVFVAGRPRLALSMAGQGPLLMFLHGIGGNRGAWDAQLEFFSRDFTAAAWDARGYGDSEDYEGPLDFRDFSADLLRLVNFLKVEKAHVIGLSMGGRIARNFALAHPGRVKSLVLANTSPGFDALSPEQVAAFVEQRRTLDPVAQAKRLLAPGARPEAFERLVASLRAVHRECYLKTVAASVAQDVAAPIERIAAPTLVIGSEHDPLYRIDIARDLARRIPGARLVELPGGHLSNLEQPERFNAAVLDFLQTVERKT
jgi:pimeloyl-ACP methyl ester carboxylesterase